MFQSTPPRGGRQAGGGGGVYAVLEFQSTPPRGGRHGQWRYHQDRAAVSIHAPARGATRSFAFRLIAPCRSFNPRPRAGGDAGGLGSCSRRSRFNPRPRAGGDLRNGVPIRDALRFQSTPPRGGRRSRRLPCAPRRRFNPRPRAGGDCGSVTRYKRAVNRQVGANLAKRCGDRSSFPGHAEIPAPQRAESNDPACANVRAAPCPLHLRARSKHQRAVRIVGCFRACMFDS